jgi:hypothetical protein
MTPRRSHGAGVVIVGVRAMTRRNHIARNQFRQAPGNEPDALTGCWGTVQAAARLYDLTAAEVLEGVLHNRVRSERKHRDLLVNLGDVAALTGGSP